MAYRYKQEGGWLYLICATVFFVYIAFAMVRCTWNVMSGKDDIPDELHGKWERIENSKTSIDRDVGTIFISEESIMVDSKNESVREHEHDGSYYTLFTYRNNREHEGGESKFYLLHHVPTSNSITVKYFHEGWKVNKEGGLRDGDEWSDEEYLGEFKRVK